MIRSVSITRLFKLLPLVEECSSEDEKAWSMQQCKSVIRSMSQQDPRSTFESGNFHFHVLVDQGIAYLCVCDRLLSKRQAFIFLESVADAFYKAFGTQVEAAQRPYAFLSFQIELSKLRKAAKDSADLNTNPYDKLHEDLGAVHRVLTRNIKDVLQRGEQLNHLSDLSSSLSVESKKFSRQSQSLKWNSMVDKYGTPFMMILLFIFIVYLWLYWF
ncbi:SNAP receptor [Mitosporidium daphniae]